MNTDPTLCKIVHRETRKGFEIMAHLTRFGDLVVFVVNADRDTVWQGQSILDARVWVDTQDVVEWSRVQRRFARRNRIARARADRFAYWHALAKWKRIGTTGDAALDRYLDTL